MGKHFHGSGEQERALAAYVKLLRASSTVSTEVTRHLSDAGLTQTQFAVLEALYHIGPMCLGEVAEKILTSGGNLTLVVNNLEKRGLAARMQAGKDRRFVRVEITPKGHKLIAEIFPDHVQRIVAVMNGLTPEEQERLGELCRKLGRKEVNQ
jgi:MarR family transcriptional regulator, 2-MHQ and catechol-resistance regulon repressor